jgi:transposase
MAHKSPVGTEALERIAALYAIEKEIRGRPPKERQEIRNLHSRPLLESLKQWLEETLGKLSRKSDTAVPVRYALGRWAALARNRCPFHSLFDRSTNLAYAQAYAS